MYYGDTPNAERTLGDQAISGNALQNAIYTDGALTTDTTGIATISNTGMINAIDTSAMWAETTADMRISNEGNLIFNTPDGDITLTPQILKRLIQIVQQEFPEDNL